MAFWDSLFGGRDTVVQQTSSAPWSTQQPHLGFAWNEARRLYDAAGPTYFPGSTVVPFSPQTEEALRATETAALQGSPIDVAGREEMLGTISGDYLSGSPFFEGAFESQVRPLVQRDAEEMLPGLQSSFTGAGFRGSSDEEAAAMRMMDSYNRALSDTAGSLAFQNYATERGRQYGAAAAAPGYAMTRFQPYQMLANVGAAREDLAQSQLADEVARHNFEQNIQEDKLARFLGLVSGGYGSEGTSTTPIFRNVGANLLGGALTGAALGGEDLLNLGAGGTAGLAGAGALLSLF